MDQDDYIEPYYDEDAPDFVEDGDRFDRPVPNKRVTKIVRSVAAVLVSAMLFAAGTPISWVSVLTAFLMFMIWIDIRSRDHDDTI
jgi:hypothetical protein